MTTTTLNVPDISCDHCKTSIEGAVRELPDVVDVMVDVATKTVAVTYRDSLSLDTVIAAIEEQGYETAT